MTTYVDVMEHHLEGLEWTVGRVGVIRGPAHVRSFAKEWGHKTPPIQEGWHMVSVENPRAKGGYAYATLPMIHLAPHACTSRCPKHLC